MACITGNRFTLDGGGLSTRSFIHIQDVCNATFELAISAKPGETFNGLTLDGELLGTRSANLSEEDAENLDLQIDRVVGVLGSQINIEANAQLDPSDHKESDSTQVFSIAAAQDVTIKGNLYLALLQCFLRALQ